MLNQLVSKYKNHPLLQEPISLQTSASAYADEQVVESESESEPAVSSSMMQHIPLAPSRPSASRQVNSRLRSDSPSTLAERERAAQPTSMPGSPLPAPPSLPPRTEALSANLVSTSKDSSSSNSSSFTSSVRSFDGRDGRQTAAPFFADDDCHARVTAALHRSPSSTPRPSDLRGRYRQEGGGGPAEDGAPEGDEGDEPFLVDFTVEEINIDFSVEEEGDDEDDEEESSAAVHLVGAYTETVDVDVAETYPFPSAAARASPLPCSPSAPNRADNFVAEESVTELVDRLPVRQETLPPHHREMHATPLASHQAETVNGGTFFDEPWQPQQPYSSQGHFHYAPTYLDNRQGAFARSGAGRHEDAKSRSELLQKSNFRDVLASVTSSLAVHQRSRFWEDSTSRACYETREDRRRHAREQAQRELVVELCLAVKPHKRELLLTLMMLSEEDNGRSASSSSTVTLGLCAEAMNVILEKYGVRATRATRALCARIAGAPETQDALNFYKLEYATFASNVLEIASSPDAL